MKNTHKINGNLSEIHLVLSIQLRLSKELFHQSNLHLNNVYFIYLDSTLPRNNFRQTRGKCPWGKVRGKSGVSKGEKFRLRRCLELPLSLSLFWLARSS